MNDQHLKRIAELLRERNAVDAEIAAIMHRPMTSGQLGEWIASQVFDIELEPTARARAIDGRFRSGQLQGPTVNIKWYLKREGLLDMSESDQLDCNLVWAGPPSGAASSRGESRPWCIEAVFLFDARASARWHAARDRSRSRHHPGDSCHIRTQEPKNPTSRENV